ncbi:CAP domain-containing protein [Candidatus Nitrospira bockiana]
MVSSRNPVRLTLIVVLLVSISPPGPIAGQKGADSQRDRADFREDLLRLVNVERATRGLAPVTENPALQRAAQWMANDLASRELLDHTDSRQRDVPARLRAFDYRRPRLVAENVAEGQERPADVVNSWLTSPAHRTNLLHPDVREAGVGFARSKAGRGYWVLDLGRR